MLCDNKAEKVPLRPIAFVVYCGLSFTRGHPKRSCQENRQGLCGICPLTLTIFFKEKEEYVATTLISL